MLTLLSAPKPVSTETANPISSETFVFDHALVMGQGVTNDGEYFYTSGLLRVIPLDAGKHNNI